MAVWFDERGYETVAAASERLVPGARAAGVVDYIDGFLGAFTFDPPRIWAGGPFSGRHGGEASFDRWTPLRPIDELAWRMRLEGSNGDPAREFNGPVVGLHEQYRDGLDALGPDFVDAPPDEQDRRLDAAPAFKALLYEHCCEGMYGDPIYGGNRGGAGWQAIDFPGDVQPRGYTDDEVTGAGDVDARVVIVGSGPGGATFAEVVTAAGWDCIVLDKGRNHLIDAEPPYRPKGDFSNDEIKFVYRHFLGPDPLLEPRTYRRRAALDGERLFTGEVNNLPSTVGGGGVHADGKVPRFREIDFRLRSEMGPIEGAAIEDWPISYADLEPYYAEVERTIGVAGVAEGPDSNPFAAWRSAAYPMPPGADMYGATLSGPAAERAGLHPYRAPTAVNSVPYDGRPACNNCGFCGHYGCPIHAKGDPVAMLRHALQTGRCRLRPECYVTEVLLDPSGRRTTGVRYLDAEGAAHELRAEHVVVAAGAFETARLLLRCGVGNSSGLVGRHLMYHFQTLTVGGFPFPLHGHRGRAVTHLHDDHIVPGDAELAAARAAGLPYFRGGIVEHGGAAAPIMESKTYSPGPAHTESMSRSDLRDRLWVFTMQGEDLPQPQNAVDLDPKVRDVWGQPAGRATYQPHEHEVACSDHVATILEAVMLDAGASWSFTATSPPTGELTALDHQNPLGLAPASRHVMGTCRMGRDPSRSVVDPESRFHDVENLLCADSSVFVTSAGYGPTLTLAALSARAAHRLTGTPLAATSPPG